MIGQQIAHYRITGDLGEGGMGKVYRATDTKLQREVALKLLPEQFASDDHRMGRFEREAQLLASLSHPNIGGIYGIEDAGGTKALVLELIEGPTLADRITRGPIPLEEAIPIARQIAEALEAAHERGVIHRDLKPANIKINPEGQVKVLDFGLAKVTDTHSSPSELADSPTLSLAATQLGMILGTAGYMSPEQAKGRSVDRRADIWAFGVVLYEILSGRRAFSGEDTSDTLAAVLRAEVDLGALPSNTPVALRRLLERCLQRELRDRLPAIAEARYQLEHLGEAEITEAESPAGGWPRSAWIAAAGLTAVAVLAMAGWWFARSGSSAGAQDPLLNLQTILNPAVAVGTNNASQVVISPDGSTLVYAGGQAMSLFVRPLAELESRSHLVQNLTDAGRAQGYLGARQPFFSPDGEWIAYFQNRTLFKLALSGGGPIPLGPIPSNPRGGTWSASGSIVYGSGNGPLFELSAEGGEPRAISGERESLEGESHRWPDFLPNSRVVVFANTPARADPNDASLEALDLASGTRTVLYRGGTFPRYSSTGHLLFVRRGDLFALAFNPETLEASQTPRLVLSNVTQETNSWGAQFSLSKSGTLIHLQGEAKGYRRLLSLVNLDGSSEQILDTPADDYNDPVVSPDGGSIALQGGNIAVSDIWVVDLRRDGARRRLTRIGQAGHPIWSPDNGTIAFGSFNEGGFAIWERSSDGSGEARQVTPPSFTETPPFSWSSDGNLILFQHRSDYQKDINEAPARVFEQVSVLDLETKTTRLLLEGDYNIQRPDFSPDARWVAYQSDESGQDEIYVVSFPEKRSKRQVSVRGGVRPRWSGDGKKLFFQAADTRLMESSVAARGSELEFGIPEALSAPELLSSQDSDYSEDGSPVHPYSWFPDGRRILRLVPAPDQPGSVDSSRLHVIVNWARLLE